MQKNTGMQIPLHKNSAINNPNHQLWKRGDKPSEHIQTNIKSEKQYMKEANSRERQPINIISCRNPKKLAIHK